MAELPPGFTKDKPAASALPPGFTKDAPPAEVTSWNEYLGALARGAGDMLTFGMDDEAIAGIKTGGGFLGDYSAAVKNERDLKKGAQEKFPKTFIAGQVAGAIPSMFVPGLNAVRGATLGAKVAKGAMTGTGMGAAYGAGSGEDLTDRLVKAGIGGATGLAVGAAVPAIGAGVGRAFGRGASKTAAGIAGRALTDDGMDAASARLRMFDLGPDAVIADLGPNLQTQAGVLASVPGRGQSIVRGTLGQRASGANQRIIGDVDATLGPAPIPTRVAAGIKSAQDALSPDYKAAFQGARAVDTTNIANAMDSAVTSLRGPAQSAIQKVRGMLNVTGSNQLDRDPYTLFQTRQAIDGMIQTEANGKVIGVLSEVRKAIDNELAARVPGLKAVDAKFAELAKQSEAFGRGQQVLDSGRTAPRPLELADEVAGASPGVAARLSQGARAEIDRIVGTNTNDVVALQKLIKGEGSWNRDRLATLFGQDRADRMLAVLEREKVFADTHGTVMRNSETARRLAAKQEIAPEFEKDRGAIQSAMNLQFGDAGWRAFDLVRKTNAATSQNARNAELARILMQGGGPRNTDQTINLIERAIKDNWRGDAAEKVFNLLTLAPSRAAGPLAVTYSRGLITP